MFIIDEKLVNKICKRIDKYALLPRDMKYKIECYQIIQDRIQFKQYIKFNVKIDITEDECLIDYISVCGFYQGRVGIGHGRCYYIGHVIDPTEVLNYIDKEQTKLINEFKKPLEYKINKLYKLIYRRIISKNLYWKDTPLITSCNESTSNDYIFNFYIKHPINESELGCVTWKFESGNHFGQYQHDNAVEKNINYILELLQEDQCS